MFEDMMSISEQAEIRSWKRAMGRGFRHRCPNCGKGHMFGKFLKVADSCNICGAHIIDNVDASYFG